ncbi:MAG TPA: S8 family serine peptidase, partial [Verrucomicrobiae bacterium]|nr:S8 family serine peptidase [Verrucomicrobiae bacterium]
MIALRPSRSVARVACLVLSLGLPCELSTLRAYGAGDKRIAPGALAEIQALEQEKAARTPAEQKLDSNLLYAHKKLVTGVASAAVPHLEPSVKIRPDGLVEVDVSASVSADLLGFITNSGGQIINSFPQYQTIRAAIPLSAVEAIAARPDVRFVDRAQEARHNFTDAEGDFCHQGALARGNFGVDGTGIKVGVLSDSDTYLTNAQAAGDLGPVTTLPGQAGPTTGEQGDGEGTAMMDVVHRIAPGAQLYFATGDPSQAQMASNILALAAAGCRIIVDDISYGGEFPFQESQPIAQAVQTVSDQGVLYFSSAANSGNEDSGTSGTWEGDFADGGAVGSPITGTGKGGGFESGRVHNFSGGTNYDFITSTGSQNGIDLWWSDAWGSSSNDYDVFVLNSTGTSVLAFSNSSQPGSPYPWEPVPANADTSFDNGELIVVVKYSGAARFLHLSAGPHFQLAFNTPGNTHGHNSSSAANAFCVAATPAYLAQEFGDPSGPYPNNPFTGGAANRVETFTSDGPRRIFYYPDGTPITPGNFSSTGGLLLQKPDITAADGVTTTAALGGNFNLFFGTSCAAPHAAAIAALLLSYNPSLNPAQVRSLLTSTALDIMATGWDRDSGYGIVMPEPALAVSPAPPPVISIINPASAIVGTPIVIYGANFATTTNVQFNGVAAQFVSLSNSVIVVTAIPAAATTGPLRIATRWGGASAMFNVLPTPAPPNDNFANATILSGTAAMVSGTTVGATKEPGEPNHAGNAGGKSIWYSWTAPEAGTFSLDTVGSSFNTLLAVYTGNAVNALTPIASNVGSGSNGTSALTFSAVLGTTYRIAVDGVGGASGSIVLRLLPAQTTI